MLKQLSNGMRKILAVLLVGLFVVSLTAVAASAAEHRNGGHGHYYGGHVHYGGHGRDGGYGGWNYGGWNYGSGCYIVNGALVCPTYGYPYI
jgi:hypothetical protein